MNNRKEYSHAYYMEHREHKIEYNKEYRRKNKESCLQRVYDWRKRHPLEASEIHRRYYERNKERLCEAARRRYWKRKMEAMSE